MSQKNGVTRVARKSLLWLLALILFFPVIIGSNMLSGEKKATFIPNLALDLSGGTQIILTPIVEKGEEVKPEQLAQIGRAHV